VNNVLVIILVVVVFLAWIILGPNWLIYRAMKKVVRALKERNSWNQASASWAEQIGIKKEPLWNSMFKVRDYRPRALQQLVELQIIVQTPEGKFFLNKNKLDESRLKDI
jgi:hypothetical protein